MQLEVSFRRIEGTGAALGWAGNKTVIAGSAADQARLLAHAEAESTISSPVARGFPVQVRTG